MGQEAEATPTHGARTICSQRKWHGTHKKSLQQAQLKDIEDQLPEEVAGDTDKGLRHKIMALEAQLKDIEEQLALLEEVVGGVD